MAPELSVVVAAGDSPLRLRWLMNALAEQTLDRSLWEVTVAYDGDDATRELLATHTLAAAGVLRATSSAGVTRGARRNTGWRLALSTTVVFVDEDCRPPVDWLANVLDAVRSNPGAVIRGRVDQDPDEEAMTHAPYWHAVDQPSAPRVPLELQNVAYPRELLELVGGYPADAGPGSDMALDVLLRATGARFVESEGMTLYHAVEDRSVIDWLRAADGLQDMALLCKRYPGLRRRLYLRVFWKRTHAWLPLALAGVVLQRRSPLAMAMVLPWAVLVEPRRSGPRGHVRHLLELPGWALIELGEITALACGSARHRSLVL
jgi:Glycosyl transferase family 2